MLSVRSTVGQTQFKEYKFQFKNNVLRRDPRIMTVKFYACIPRQSMKSVHHKHARRHPRPHFKPMEVGAYSTAITRPQQR